MKKVSQKDFNLFQKKVKEYINIFGLVDWKVRITQADLDDSFAQVSFNVESRQAVFELCKEFNDNIYDIMMYNPAMHAYHEVLHLLLADIHDVVTTTELGWQQKRNRLTEVEHRLIRLFENLYFPLHEKGAISTNTLTAPNNKKRKKKEN